MEDLEKAGLRKRLAREKDEERTQLRQNSFCRSSLAGESLQISVCGGRLVRKGDSVEVCGWMGKWEAGYEALVNHYGFDSAEGPSDLISIFKHLLY